MDIITSTQNQGIKDVLKLSKAKVRRETGLFTIEGEREIRRAYENAYKFHKVFYCKKQLNKKSRKLIDLINCDHKLEVSEKVFARITYRDNSDGLFAIAYAKPHNLDDLEIHNSVLYLVIEKVEKPGNLGAMLRTADAAGIDGIILCDNETDLYNPNVIRSSIGCIFTKKIAVCDSESAIGFLKNKGIMIYAAALQDSESYSSIDFKGSSAIVMGSEADGLSEIWRKAADKIISIPMKGDVDSLNVSVSAAILIFEALRQRM